MVQPEPQTDSKQTHYSPMEDTGVAAFELNILGLELYFKRISQEEFDARARQLLGQASSSQIDALSNPNLSGPQFKRLASGLFDSAMAQENLKNFAPSPLADDSAQTLEAHGEKPGSPPKTRVENANDTLGTQEGSKREFKSAPLSLRGTGTPIDHDVYKVTFDSWAVFYSVDDLIRGRTRDWLSVPRIAGLACLVLACALPFLLPGDKPPAAQAMYGSTHTDPSPTQDAIPSESALSTAESSDTDGFGASEPPRISAVRRANATFLPSQNLTSPKPDFRPPESESRSLESPPQAIIEKANEEESVAAPSENEQQNAFENIIHLIEQGQTKQAIGELKNAWDELNDADLRVAKLLKNEALLTQGDTLSRNTVWDELLAAPASEATQLQAVRWLLTSSNSERANALLNANANARPDLIRWLAMRQGDSRAEPKQSRTQANLPEKIHLDLLFQATVDYNQGNQKNALKALTKVRDSLQQSVGSTPTSPALAWVFRRSRNTLLVQVEMSIQRISDIMSRP